MKTIKLFLITSFCVLVCMACQDKVNELSSLKGTKWKLAGIVPPTGGLTQLAPTDCEECFTLAFNTDSTATVHSIEPDTFILDLFHLHPNVLIEDILRCEVYDKDGQVYCDGDKFRRAIWSTKSYVATRDELKLYYPATGENYLLLKRITE